MPYRHALVLGKFMPIHAGHVHLIEAAARAAERVTVLVCTLRREPIAGALRFGWAMDALAHLPTVRVVHVNDEVPVQPEESPDFWTIWVPLIVRYCGADLDVVFTSEAYGAELGRRLGIPDVCLDPARTAVPVSATLIRANPWAHWAFVPMTVRPHYVRRVALLGPESSGKTTLAALLAARFGTDWVPEFVRDYLDDGPNLDTIRPPTSPPSAPGSGRWNGLTRAPARRPRHRPALLRHRRPHHHRVGRAVPGRRPGARAPRRSGPRRPLRPHAAARARPAVGARRHPRPPRPCHP